MTIAIQSQVNNPVTGAFGTGNVQFFSTSGTWNVPPGIGKVRVRLWGAGGTWSNFSGTYGGGGGGGFALKTIYDLTGVSSVAVTVGTGAAQISVTGAVTSGTSSFGSYVSATGGTAGAASAILNIGGTGVGGDINFTGGYGGFGGGTNNFGGGGGAASVFGSGGYGGSGTAPGGMSLGGAGGGGGTSTQALQNSGGPGFLSNGAYWQASTYAILPQSGLTSFSIDFLGTGGGGAAYQSAINGGGGGVNSSPGFPGGGSGNNGTPTGVNGSGTFLYGAPGLVIVEW